MKLVSNWKDVLLRAWVVRIAALGLVLPELIDLLLKVVDASTSLSPDTKMYIRTAALALVIIFRPVKQQNLSTGANP